MATDTDQRQHSSARDAAAIVDAIRSIESPVVALSISDQRSALSPGAELGELITTTLDDVSQGREVTSAPASLPIGTEVASGIAWCLTALADDDARPR